MLSETGALGHQIAFSDANGNTVRKAYDENNRVVGVIKPDGSVTTTEYDNAGRVISTTERNARGVLITGFEYTYDTIGRVSTEKHLDKNIRMCYTYDERSRVTQRANVNYDTGETIEESFTYDAAGNIMSAADIDCCDTDSFTYDKNNRITYYTGTAVSYDADGNMTSTYHDGHRDTLRYDSTNRLIGTNTNAYTYNAENVRICKNVLIVLLNRINHYLVDGFIEHTIIKCVTMLK